MDKTKKLSLKKESIDFLPAKDLYSTFLEDPYSIRPIDFTTIFTYIKSKDFADVKAKIKFRDDDYYDFEDKLLQISHSANRFFTHEDKAHDDRILNSDIVDLVEERQCIIRNKFRCVQRLFGYAKLEFAYPYGLEKATFEKEFEDFRSGEIVLLRYFQIRIEFKGKIDILLDDRFLITVPIDESTNFLNYFEDSECVPRELFNLGDNHPKLIKIYPDIIVMPKRNIIQSFQYLEYLIDSSKTGIRNPDLVNFLLYDGIHKIPNISAKKIDFFDKALNKYQMNAVEYALATPVFYMIDGPAGTGKTRVLCEIISQLARQEKKVLVCAQTPAALDNIIQRFVNTNFIRSCHIGSKEKELKKGSFHVESFLKYNIELSEQKMKFDSMPRYDPRDIINPNYIDQLSSDLIQLAVSFSNVIFATLPDLDNEIFRQHDLFFDVCIIDECSQAIELSSWLGIMRAKKLIIAGDECQLQPYVLSKFNKNEKLVCSLFKRMKSHLPAYKMDEGILRHQRYYELLKTQYRMNAKILEWSNMTFYDGMLRSEDTCSQYTLDEFRRSKDHTTSPYLIFINTEGLKCNEVNVIDSKANLYEAAYVIEILRKLVEEYTLKATDLGVISPYRPQSNILKKIFHQGETTKLIKAWSIDGFQGNEREVIIISLVRSNPSRQVGFVNDLNRLNVSVTRAKRLLVVIGDFYTLAGDKSLDPFVKFIKESGIDFLKENPDWREIKKTKSYELVERFHRMGSSDQNIDDFFPNWKKISTSPIKKQDINIEYAKKQDAHKDEPEEVLKKIDNSLKQDKSKKEQSKEEHSDYKEERKFNFSAESDRKIISRQTYNNYVEKPDRKKEYNHANQKSDFPPLSYNQNDFFASLKGSQSKSSISYEMKSEKKLNAQEKSKESKKSTKEDVSKKLNDLDEFPPLGQ